MRFRDDVSPAKYLITSDALDHIEDSFNIDLAGYEQRTGGRIDYVLVWDLPEISSRSIYNLSAQLKQTYDLIYTSPQNGLMKVYRRKNL